MAITLRVSSYQSHSLGSDATRVFDVGGTIGRAPGNDWVLPDPERFVSGQHAVIALENGAYFLIDRSTNGTIVNGQTLASGARVRLQTGDLLTVGNYEITVSIGAAAAVQQPPTHMSAPAAGWHAPDPEQMAGRQSSVDPLDFFAAAPTPARSIPAGAEHDHAPPDSAFFAPPPVRPDPLLAPQPEASPPSAAGPVPIPENWDDTGFLAPAPEPPPSPPVQSAPPATAAPPAWAPSPPPAPEPAPPPAAPAPAAGFEAPLVSAAATTGTVRGLAALGADPGAPPAAMPAADLGALLRGAGLDPATVDEATLEALGQILRVVVDGLLDVLQARAAIKNQFRVAMTTLKPVENNPLKFSANADDALFNLFTRRGQSYLAPVEAFREAFDDLKAHQLAMMAGMRAAFGAVLARFDPEQLQEAFDKGLKRGALLDVMNKTKYWDLYREMYAELGNDDATFRRLFGDEFAQAYEEQMQRLSAVRQRR